MKKKELPRVDRDLLLSNIREMDMRLHVRRNTRPGDKLNVMFDTPIPPPIPGDWIDVGDATIKKIKKEELAIAGTIQYNGSSSVFEFSVKSIDIYKARIKVKALNGKINIDDDVPYVQFGDKYITFYDKPNKRSFRQQDGGGFLAPDWIEIFIDNEDPKMDDYKIHLDYK